MWPSRRRVSHSGRSRTARWHRRLQIGSGGGEGLAGLDAPGIRGAGGVHPQLAAGSWRAEETVRVTRVGLVLGAGGVVGQAYHAGVLAVPEHDFGFDPRAVDMIVGTSAGSITGTLLRLGVKAEDLAAWTVKAPLSGDDDVLRQIADTPVPELAPFRPLELLLRPMRLPAPRMVQRALTRPWRFRPLAAAMALVAPGRHDIVEQ